jgi:prophage tail gpP-like protein
VQLKIGGQLFGGWKSLRAEAGIEQCAGAFDLSVTDRSVSSVAWPIDPGAACELLLNGESIINGYVDTVKPSIDRQSHGIRVSGRDKTADLIDCSAVYKTGQWKNATLAKIAADIAQPFHIEVVLAQGVDVGAAFDSFNIEDGERAFEAIERAARMRAVLVMTDGAGRLVLTTASKIKTGAALVEGVNVLQAELELSWKERYSEITVKGQGKGTATQYGAAVAHGKASIADAAIKRYRPLIVIAEQHGLGPTFEARAEWERNVRRGRSTRVVVRVQGWTYPAAGMPGGAVVWRPNMLVNTQLPYLGLQQDLLIAKCVYTLDDGGSFTELQLADPRAFQLLNGIKGTKLGRKIEGVNGLEVNRRHAKNKARRKKQESREVAIDGNTGESLMDDTP